MRLLTLAATPVILSSFEKCWAEEFIESKLNLAYTINIAKFVKWSVASDETTICLSSESKLYPYAKNVSTVEIDEQRKVRIQIDPGSIDKCNIVYWDEISVPALSIQDIVSNAQNTLFITDSKMLFEQGFGIQFFVRNLKVRFHINGDVVKDRNYQISSKLMRLSRNLD